MTSHQLPSKLVDVLHSIFWFLLFVVFPLTVNPNAFTISAEAYALLPKALVLAITCTVGIIALLLTYPKISFLSFAKGIKRQPLTLLLWLMLCVFLLVDAFLVPGESAINLLGSQGRLNGFLLQAAWYALVPISAGLFCAHAKKNQVRWFIFIGAFIAALWTLLQSYGFEPIMRAFSADLAAEGPLALTGFTAAYLAVIIIVYLASTTTFRPFIALGIGLMSAALVSTGNRTAPAALILIGIFFVILHLIQKKFYILRIVLLYIFVSIAFVGVWHITNSRPIEQVERTARFVQGNDSSFQVRVILWQTALRGMVERPLMGHGANGFSEVFWRHASRDEKLFIVNTRLPAEATNIRFTNSPVVLYSLPNNETLVSATFNIDQAHNYLLDLAIASGLLSVGLFVAAVISGVVMMVRAGDCMARAVALGVCVYAIFGVTWFASLPVDPLVWGLFGIGVGSALRTHVAPPMTTLRKDS